MQLAQDYHKTTTASVLEQRVDQFTAIMRSWLAALPERPISHLVYRGVSGACMAWPLSYRLKIPVVAVRKPGEACHGYDPDDEGVISGYGDLFRYIIVDDFISSGATIRAIIHRIDKAWERVRAKHSVLMPILSDATTLTQPVCEAIFLHDIAQGGPTNFYEHLTGTSDGSYSRTIPIISCETRY